MKTRIVHTKIWKDDYFASLTPSEKLLFVYFLTNEYVNIIHLYECSDRVIQFDTGIDPELLDQIKNKFEASKKFRFNNGWIYIPNAYRYEKYVGQINEKAKLELISRLPKDILAWFYNISDTPINTPIDTPQIGTINNKSKIINQKLEVINNKSEIINSGEKKYEFIGGVAKELN